MTITFYNNQSALNVIDKVLTGEIVREGNIVNEFDEYDPILDVDDSLTTHNYAEINGAFYYITNIEHRTNNVARITFHLDVLKTFRSEIMNASIYAMRSSAGDRNKRDELVTISEERYNVQSEYEGFDTQVGMWILSTSQDRYN